MFDGRTAGPSARPRPTRTWPSATRSSREPLRPPRAPDRPPVLRALRRAGAPAVGTAGEGVVAFAGPPGQRLTDGARLRGEMYEPAATRVDTLAAGAGERAKASRLEAGPGPGLAGGADHLGRHRVDAGRLGASKKVEAVVASVSFTSTRRSSSSTAGRRQRGAAAGGDRDHGPGGLDEPGPGDGGEAKNLHRYSGSFACERAGRYGFTVRVVRRTRPADVRRTRLCDLGRHVTLGGQTPTQGGKCLTRSLRSGG